MQDTVCTFSHTLFWLVLPISVVTLQLPSCFEWLILSWFHCKSKMSVMHLVSLLCLSNLLSLPRADFGAPSLHTLSSLSQFYHRLSPQYHRNLFIDPIWINTLHKECFFLNTFKSFLLYFTFGNVPPSSDCWITSPQDTSSDSDSWKSRKCQQADSNKGRTFFCTPSACDLCLQKHFTLTYPVLSASSHKIYP